MSTLVTGGARGSDEVWMKAVSRRPGVYKCEIESFPGHSLCPIPPGALVRRRTREELQKAPTTKARDEYTRNLLARNFFVIHDTQAFYFVAKFSLGGRVEGGTGHALSLFLQLHPGKPVFGFDVATARWMERRSGKWAPFAKEEGPPSPRNFDRWAGVGTRDPCHSGTAAIYKLIQEGRPLFSD